MEPLSEVFLAGAVCAAMFGGDAEVRTNIHLRDDSGYIRADCITDSHYIEFGFDNTATSRDSITQAVSGAYLRGLEPMVVLFDRDGVEDTHQWEVELTAARADVAFRLVHINQALRMVMSHHSRTLRDQVLALSPVDVAANSRP